jgi:hypothetical protein
MRSSPNTWKTFWARLGFKSKKRSANRRRAYHRTLRFEQCEDRCMLATFMVTNTYDGDVTGPGDQPGTLRQAIFDAEELDGPDIIEFAPGLNGEIITLGKDANGNPTFTGELFISESVTIDASMLAAGITIDAGNGMDEMPGTGDGSRIFHTQSFGGTTNVLLDGLTLTGGDPGTSGGAILSAGANLTIQNSTISGNTAGWPQGAGDGGGVHYTGTNVELKILANSTISGNGRYGWNSASVAILILAV